MQSLNRHVKKNEKIQSLNKHVQKTTVELTCNALSHVDEILLDNKAEETNTTIQFARLTMGPFFSNASKQHIIRHSAMQMVVMMVVMMMMHVAMRREGAPTQTTTCSMIIYEQKNTTHHAMSQKVGAQW